MYCKFKRLSWSVSTLIALLVISSLAWGQGLPSRDHDHYAAHWCLDKVQECPDTATTMTSTYPDLMDWSAVNDPLMAYYAISTPLAARGAPQGTAYQVLPFMMFSTSVTPAHMVVDDAAPAALLTSWHYLSAVDYFGGSQGEGQVLAPSPGWIKAAHQNGVKIEGSIFLSPLPFGGDKEQQAIDQLFAPCGYGKVCKSYPEADKLIAIAKAYDFDGYFINEEARWLSADLATAVANFIDYIHVKAPSLRIDWYPGTTAVASDPEQIVLMKDGHVVSDDIFMDYGWSWGLDDALAGAQSIGYPAAKLDFGFDAEGGSYGSLSDWNLLLDGQHQARGSIAEFGFQGVLCSGRCDGQSIEHINTQERQFWAGDAPGVVSNFKALARDPEYTQRLSVTLPFVTYFNTGQGRHYFQEGQASGLGRWHDMASQDLLPILRVDTAWHYNYDSAWLGGSSLDMTDSGSGQAIDLYDVALERTAKRHGAAALSLQVVYRYTNVTTDSVAQILLQDEAGHTLTQLKLPVVASQRWQSLSLALAIDASQVAHISLQFVALAQKPSKRHGNTELMLGQIFLGIPTQISHPVSDVGIKTLGVSPAGEQTWWQLTWPQTDKSKSKHSFDICAAGHLLGRTQQHVFAFSRQTSAGQPQHLQVIEVSSDMAGKAVCPSAVPG